MVTIRDWLVGVPLGLTSEDPNSTPIMHVESTDNLIELNNKRISSVPDLHNLSRRRSMSLVGNEKLNDHAFDANLQNKVMINGIGW